MKMMSHTNSFLKSPKKEEEQVPDDIMDDLDLEGILGIDDDDEEKLFSLSGNSSESLSWDMMDWELARFHNLEDEEENQKSCFRVEEEDEIVLKKENGVGFWDIELDDERKVLSLNLNLNYQEVLDAWSDRGPLWTNNYTSSTANYMGEVPDMEEERRRREASVLRYKEKRQNRLFCKKIRYQVRKLNADKRPRLKGRFVKRV